jgi:hypothetical protein
MYSRRAPALDERHRQPVHDGQEVRGLSRAKLVERHAALPPIEAGV